MTLSDLFALARADPSRALVCSVVPLLVAVAQVANALYHGVALHYVGLFALALAAFAVLATQYSLAAHRVEETWSSGVGSTAD